MAYSPGAFTARLPFYSRVGGISGAIEAGIVERVLQNTATLPPTGLILVGAFAVATTWLFVLLLFGKWMRFTVAQIWLPSLVVIVTTGLIIVWLITRFPSNHSILIGFVVGVAIGYLFTFLCAWVNERGYLNRT